MSQRMANWLTVCCLSLTIAGAHAATLNVPGTYPTIQDAVNAATSGVDTIEVTDSASYPANIDTLGKDLTIRATATPAAQITGVLFSTGAETLIVEDFAFTGAGDAIALQLAGGKDVTIRNCTFAKGGVSVAVNVGGGGAVRLENCDIDGGLSGIALAEPNVALTLDATTVRNLTFHGIELFPGAGGAVISLVNGSTITGCDRAISNGAPGVLCTLNGSHLDGNAAGIWSMAAAAGSTYSLTDSTISTNTVLGAYLFPDQALTLNSSSVDLNAGEGVKMEPDGGLAGGTVTIANSNLRGNGTLGVWLADPGATLRIYASRIVNGAGDFNTIDVDTADVRIVNSVIEGGFFGLVLTNGAAATQKVINCTLVADRLNDASNGGVLINGGDAEVSNCIILGFSAGIGGANTGFANLVMGPTADPTLDPGFVAPSPFDPATYAVGSGDFRLAATIGPAYNQGGDTSAYTSVDFAGNPRPFNNLTDIGAFESQQFPTSPLLVPEQFPTIQNAALSARSGDEILVTDGGLYIESVDPFGRDLTIRSTSTTMATILGTIFVAADETVLLEGFRLEGAGDGLVVLNPGAKDVTLRGCHIDKDGAGVGVQAPVARVRVEDTTIINSGFSGVLIGAAGAWVSLVNSTVTSNTFFGIELLPAADGARVDIATGSVISDNDRGVYCPAPNATINLTHASIVDSGVWGIVSEPGAGGTVFNLTGATISGSTFEAIYIHPQQTLNIAGSTISGNGNEAVEVLENAALAGGTVSITSSTLEDNGGFGVQILDPGLDVAINKTFLRSGAGDFDVVALQAGGSLLLTNSVIEGGFNGVVLTDAAAATHRILNCTMAADRVNDSSHRGVFIFAGDATVSNCIVLGYNTPIEGTNVGLNNLTMGATRDPFADPGFVTPGIYDPATYAVGTGDFRLASPSSPAFNGGIDLAPAVIDDLLGVPRPQEGAFDVGAFEYRSPNAARGVWALY